MTHNEYQQKNNLNQRTAAYRIKTVCGVGFVGLQPLTPDQLTALGERFGDNSQPKKREKTAKMVVAQTAVISVKETATTPTAKVKPTAKQDNANTERAVLFFAPLCVTAVSVTLTICGLKMFAHWYGVGLGCMFGLMLFSAVIVSRNSQKGDTSTIALSTVLYLELGACLLHPFTFFSQMPMDANYWVKVTASCIASAFVALLSYRSVLIVRNYNAEI